MTEKIITEILPNFKEKNYSVDSLSDRFSCYTVSIVILFTWFKLQKDIANVCHLHSYR